MLSHTLTSPAGLTKMIPGSAELVDEKSDARAGSLPRPYWGSGAGK